ncbi:unnamed protein product, partial [Didymodactylos carnosus]
MRASNQAAENDAKIADEEREQDLEMAIELRYNTVFDIYINDMFKLIYENRPSTPETWLFATAKTDSTVRQLDAQRKSYLLEFVAQAKLIGNNVVVSRQDVDLGYIRLNGMTFDYVNLSGLRGIERRN